MTEIKPKYTIRGSATGININGVSYSGYNASCFRTILLRNENLQEEKPSDFPVFALGRYFETWFKSQLLCSYEEEVEAKFEIIPDVWFEGHADICIGDTVYELKSVSSLNTHRQVFTKGLFKKSNLIQLCGYLLSTENTKGRLVYGSYVDVLEYRALLQLTESEVLEIASQTTPQIKIFDVEFTDAGEILVDGKAQDFTTNDIIAFWQEMAARLVDDETEPLPPRPIDIEKGKGTSCFFCSNSPTCNKNPSSKKEFLALVKDSRIDPDIGGWSK